MTLNFTRPVDSGPIVGRTVFDVLGVEITVHTDETKVRFWFEPSQISTVYWLRTGESVTVGPDVAGEPS